MSKITENYANTEMPGGPTQKRGGSNITWVLVVIASLLVIALPTMIILFFGMLPSVVAFIIDRTKGRSAAITVSGLNLIGVFPFIMDLWKGGNTFDQALNMLDIFTMLIMYSAAGMGWLLFMTTPTIISSFVMVLQQRKIASLRKQQKNLIEEWGPEVAALTEGFDETGSMAPHTLSGNAAEPTDGSVPPP
ncbi:MAG: hypothetical protein KAI27_04200 [Rhodospirillaceae bacterium]|nr:hypothetical protein [Rhodospirillaceae bacterium]